MTAQSQASPTDAFVTALHESACQLATVLAHMEAFRRSGRSISDAPDPADTLRLLLGDILTPALSGFSDGDLRAASRAVSVTVATVSEELLLVSPDAVPLQRPRRRRGPRR
jgi:hypothetical protein